MSTNKSEKLSSIIDQQEALLVSLKEQAKSIDNDYLVEENEQLSKALNATKDENSTLKDENDSLKKQLTISKNALFSKMADEKLMVFSSTQKKIEQMYYKDSKNLENRLDEYKKGCQLSIEQTIKVIEGYSDGQYDEILQKFQDLQKELETVDFKVKEYKKSEIGNLNIHNNNIGSKLREEELTENEKRTGLKQKSIESFVGLNILSKAGILLFLVGIIMLGRFAYINMSDVFKGGLIFALGAVLIGIGELFHKKEKSVFSTVLISGGVAVLYAATATGYFAFSLYNVKVVFLLCIAVTVIAILLSNQIKSQVVCAFGAIGGYLPVVAIFMVGFGKAASDVTFLPISSVYFCVLAIVLLLMTYNKKWFVAQFIGYFLHLVAIGGVADCAWTLKSVAGYGYALPLACAFSITSFIIYLLMPASKIFLDKKVIFADVVLLGLNTVSGAISVGITMHNCFEEGTANRAVGIVFLLFTVLYAVLMSKSNREKNNISNITTIISSISALIFSMLVVPYIFGLSYAPIAWAIEGAILAIFSIQKKMQVPEFAGLICLIISASSSIVQNYNGDVSKTLSVISFSVIVACVWSYCIFGLIFSENKTFYAFIEIVNAVATFAYLRYIYSCIIDGPLVQVYSNQRDVLISIIIALALCLALQMGVLKNKMSVMFVDIIGILLIPITVIRLNIITGYNDALNFYKIAVSSKASMVINIVLIIIVNIAVNLLFSKSVSNLLNKFKAPMWIYTASISVSSLALITSLIMSQFGIKFSSIIISGLYIISACILLFVGFKKRYTVVRSGGLAIILCAFAKLCFIDTSNMDSSWKIGAYFVFGALLIVISYVYQKFSKRLEQEAMAEIEEKEEQTV